MNVLEGSLYAKPVILILVIAINFILFSLILLNSDSLGQITGFVVSNIQDSRVYILSTSQGKDVTFLIPINNDENEIDNIYAELKILDLNGNEVAVLETQNMRVSPNESAELRAIWFNSGFDESYEVRILVFDDEQTYSFSKIFNLEKEIITFESVVVQDFSLGDVVNLSAIVKNHLEEELNDVFVSILILEGNGNTISEIVSEKKNIGENSLGELEIIWDTKNIRPGRYNAQMIINYDEKFIDKEIIINVQQGVFDIVGVGYSIVGNIQEDSKNQRILFFLVIFLLILNLAWIFYYAKSRKEASESLRGI